MDQITHQQAQASSAGATPSAILGPFWRSDTPVRPFGSSIVLALPDGAELTYLYGTVTDARSGKPIENALVDIWEASTNGKYSLPPLGSNLIDFDRTVRTAGCRAARAQFARKVLYK